MSSLSLLKIKNIVTSFLFVIVLQGCNPSVSEEKQKDYAKYVNPFICTANDHGQTDPSAGVPWGMVKPCADMYPMGHAGYDYSSDTIIGFSHNRLSGVGCQGAGGNLRIFPTYLGDPALETLKCGYFKDSEKAKAGYYAVKLNNNVNVELTATRQIAFHQYTFPKDQQPVVVIDLASSFDGVVSENHRMNDDHTISGSITGKNVCQMGSYEFYFAIETDPSFKDWQEDGAKIAINYAPREDNTILLKCALSTVSEQNAKDALKEAQNCSLRNVADEAYTAWNEKLNVISVETANDTLKRIFYTHLFHALQTPFSIRDKDGTYRGSDGITYLSERQTYYHGWSIWDTFRTKLPLFSLLYPQEFSEMMWSIGELYKQGKPKWATETEPFITVRTEHAIVALLDAYKKGLLHFPLEEIYSKLAEEIENLSFKSPDNVLESSYDLWCMAQISKELGLEAEYRSYQERAYQYKSTWVDKFKDMDEHADIMHGDGLYEGTLWQYRWFVPFDIEGLQALMGGKKAFEEHLDYFFDQELFNMGNQPDIQTPFLYAFTQSPWKTQRLVNKILTKETNNWYGTHIKRKSPVVKKVFTDTPDGYIPEMDDDAGTMASWYICSSIGLYPICPGDPTFVITSPLFDRIIIRTQAKDLEIIAHGLTSKASYIQKITFNGRLIEDCFIDFNEIKNGGKLELYMGESPRRFRE